MSVIAFDVDGTLVTYNDRPRRDIINLLVSLSVYHTIIVWSGGGKDYAEHWCRKLMIDDCVSGCRDKPKETNPAIDICFDDEYVELAKVNLKV